MELQEQPLGPSVIGLVRGVEAPRPVGADRVALEGRGLRLDVGVGPVSRVRVVLDRRVLGGQPEGVPTDRVQHVASPQTSVASRDVADGEGLSVAHVQITGGVGEHVQHVPALAVILRIRLEGAVLLPERLPARLDLSEVVLLGLL